MSAPTPDATKASASAYLSPVVLGACPTPSTTTRYIADTTTTKPNTESTWTSPRLACGASLLLSAARNPRGTSTVAPAATAPSGPGQPTSRCRTVATSATVAASVTPIPNHS